MPGEVLGNVASLILAWAALAVALGILWRFGPVRWVRHQIGRAVDEWHRQAVREVVTEVLDNGNRINDRLDTITAELEQIRGRGD